MLTASELKVRDAVGLTHTVSSYRPERDRSKVNVQSEAFFKVENPRLQRLNGDSIVILPGIWL